MQQRVPEQSSGWLNVLFDRATYRNMAYVWSSLPLGIFYFEFTVTGISLSAGLLVIFLGIPVFLFTVAGSKAFLRFEKRWAAQVLYGEEARYQDSSSYPQAQSGFWAFVRKEITDPMTYASFLFVLVKFVIGIFAFTLSITLFAVGLGMSVISIVYYAIKNTLDINILENDGLNTLFSLSDHTLLWIYTVIGIVIFYLAFHANNGLARWLARLSLALSGSR